MKILQKLNFIFLKGTNMKKLFIIFWLFATMLYCQVPLTLQGQSFLTLNNSLSLEQAKIQCKQLATINAIETHLLTLNPNLELNNVVIECILGNLFNVNVVEEEISDVDLYRRVIISTNSQYITMCIPN